MSPELVSVVLIAYNGKQYIAQQIESILAQTHLAIELIVSDDNSSDGTRDVVERYADDRRLRLIRNNGARGIHGNLENALAHAAGDVIAISDQDDIWERDKIERLLAGLRDKDAVFCDSALIDEAGSIVDASFMRRLSPNPIVVDREYWRLLLHNCVSGHALLFRRELLDLLLPFPELPVYDQQIALAAAAGKGLSFEPGVLVQHRLHDANTTNRFIHGSEKRRGGGHSKVRSRRNRIRILQRSVDIVLRRLSESARGDARLQAVHNHLGRPAIAKRLADNSGERRFDLRLFLLLLPLRCELRYFHRGKRSPLRALISLCVY